jgi:plastocyanin domain-containing protein
MVVRPVGGAQVVEIVVDRGYRPQSIVARAGVPLRVVFHRRDDEPCMDRVVFSAPRLERRLARGTATTIALPAQPEGEIRFACGMGRYHGQIALRAAGRSRMDEVRVRASDVLRRRGIHGFRRASARDQTTHEDRCAGATAPVNAMGEIDMDHEIEPTRSDRRAAVIARRRSERRRTRSVTYRQEQRRNASLRMAAFGVIAAGVLGAGVWLAAGDLIGQRGSATIADATTVRMSMAGFEPGEIRVPAGQTVALELWTTDAAPHLMDGVHTMISDELGIYEELPAAGPTGESRRVVQIETPPTPGVYDIYCDTCCGGKDSPTMHGKLIVEA